MHSRLMPAVQLLPKLLLPTSSSCYSKQRSASRRAPCTCSSSVGIRGSGANEPSFTPATVPVSSRKSVFGAPRRRWRGTERACARRWRNEVTMMSLLVIRLQGERGPRRQCSRRRKPSAFKNISNPFSQWRRGAQCRR